MLAPSSCWESFTKQLKETRKTKKHKQANIKKKRECNGVFQVGTLRGQEKRYLKSYRERALRQEGVKTRSPFRKISVSFVGSRYTMIMRQGRGSKLIQAVFSLWAKSLFIPGWGTECQYLVSLSVRLSCVRVKFFVFTDCEGCTGPSSTNPGSMEAGEYGLTCGTCFVECRLEFDAVAGLLWISWWVLGGADFCVFFVRFFSIERTWPAASTRPPSLVYLSASTSLVYCYRMHAFFL